MTVLRVTSTLDALVNELRERIFSGQLPPGEPIGEIALADTYHVARPTVRTAIQQLVAGGLLVREPGRSARVPVFTVDDLDDLFLMRTPLELHAVTILAAKGMPDLETLLDRIAAIGPDTCWAEQAAANSAFHVALVDAVGSPRLSRAYGVVNEEMRLCLVQLRTAYPDPSGILADHRALLDAIGAGDEGRARDEMISHLRRSRRAFAGIPPEVSLDERASSLRSGNFVADPQTIS